MGLIAAIIIVAIVVGGVVAVTRIITDAVAKDAEQTREARRR